MLLVSLAERRGQRNMTVRVWDGAVEVKVGPAEEAVAGVGTEVYTGVGVGTEVLKEVGVGTEV